MKYFSLLLAVVLFISCSKPTQDNTASADSTGSASSTPPVAKDEMTPSITFTPEETAVLNMEVFLYLHEFETFGYDTDIVALKEEFEIGDDQHFTYKIYRDNGGRAGTYSDMSGPGNRPSLPERDKGKQPEAEEGDEQEEDMGDEYEPYSSNEGVEINAVDTVELNGSYIISLEEDVESNARKVRIGIYWNEDFTNFHYIRYGEIKSVNKSESFSDDFLIDLNTPRILGRDQLYLKAKVSTLSDQDLTGMSKDDLGLLRNEIFARHGHTFKTDKMKEYFNPKEWYHSLVDDATSLLNKFEKQNVDFIKKLESK